MLRVQSALLVICVWAQPIAAETPQEKGVRIATEVDVFNNGFQGESSDMTMVLINAHGDQTKRTMKSETMEVSGDGDKSLITFTSPADVDGTKMLTWTYKTKNDDQWIYLPAFKRVRRISSRNKSGAFMGSEFAYEDLGSQEVEKYSYTWLRDERVDGRECWVMERVPKDSRSGYSKQVVWTDKAYHQAVKIDFYDRKGELLKTFTLSAFEAFGKYWRPGLIAAKNHQTKKQSTLAWTQRSFGIAPDAARFTKDKLEDW